MKRIVCLLALLASASVAPAQHCYTQSYQTYQAPYVAPTVVYQTPTIVSLVLPVSYLGYVAPVVPAVAPPTPLAAAAPVTSNNCDRMADVMGELLREVRAMRAERSQSPPPAAPPPQLMAPAPLPKAPPAAPPSPEEMSKLRADGIAAGMAVCRTRCAACHEAKVAKVKGKGFVLLVGDQLAPLSFRQRLEVVKQVHDGDMPKNGKASDYEYNAIFALVSNLPPPTN